MNLIYSRQDFSTLARAQEQCYLMANGLGGYSSLSAAYSMTRADQGLLVSARTAPNDRVTLLARLQETLEAAGRAPEYLSTQEFTDGTPAEEGYRWLSGFMAQDVPQWRYDVHGVRVTRELAMADRENTLALRWVVENRTGETCTLTIRPFVLGFEKGHAPLEKWPVSMADGCIVMGSHRLYVQTTGDLAAEPVRYALQAYRHDAPEGRPEKGLTSCPGRIRLTVAPGETRTLETVFSAAPIATGAQQILAARRARMAQLRETAGLTDPVAQQLVMAADAFIVDRASTGGRSIIAGYPFFGDWGRDTMIALPGCCLSTGRYDEAKSILRTFLAYEKDGLVPNLFPEGENAPMYNTVDAALLLINTVWLYVARTGDLAFAREAWPVMESIVRHYRRGTHHGIRMEADGLITAGEGFDQVTWMDVRIGEILPTPRHGKPVEINAYWYSALRIMDAFAAQLGLDQADYAPLAEQVKESFLREFWLPGKGCLKDVVSGTGADDQLRCNQIWAVTQPFTMLSPEQEKAVVDAVYAHLYTPCGLRTLSPEDPQYHGVYEGVQKERDMAYHQGTVWPFPLGAYYLAHLKVYGDVDAIREALAPMAATLREGCAGQLPEIYDGDAPSRSLGCFAQAWSVGEILRVYEALEKAK